LSALKLYEDDERSYKNHPSLAQAPCGVELGILALKVNQLVEEVNPVHQCVVGHVEQLW
jgi:hypothetical protein